MRYVPIGLSVVAASDASAQNITCDTCLDLVFFLLHTDVEALRVTA